MIEHIGILAVISAKVFGSGFDLRGLEYRYLRCRKVCIRYRTIQPPRIVLVRNTVFFGISIYICIRIVVVTILKYTRNSFALRLDNYSIVSTFLKSAKDLLTPLAIKANSLILLCREYKRLSYIKVYRQYVCLSATCLFYELCYFFSNSWFCGEIEAINVSSSCVA